LALGHQECDGSNDPCTGECTPTGGSNEQICKHGNYTCNLTCSQENGKQTCMAKKCNLEYSGNNSSQRCIGEVERCKMDCNRGDCDQLCNGKEYCIMQCSGKKCTQRCNGPAKGCKMNCSGEECNQYCNAEEDCDMQCSGENCTQRYNGQVKRCNMKCSGRECKQYCKGKESCKMQCSDGEVCNQLCNGEGDCILRCNGEGCDQRCSGQAKGCNVTCSGKRCNQCCNAQVKSCNMQCSGKNCTQDCKRQLDKCNMQCNGIICEQTCHAHTCNMTRYGPRNRLTKQICRSGNGTCYQHIMMQCSMGSFDINCYRSGRCIASKRLNSDCSPSILYTSNVVKSASITTIQVNASVSEFSRIEISRNSSMQEAISLLEDFTDRYINFSKSHKGELGVGEVKAVTESVFRVAVAFEEFALNYGKYHLSGTEPSKTIVRQKMVLSIQKGYRQNTTDFSLEENELQATINISSANFAENGSVVIGCVYRELHELLQTNQDIEKENGNSRYVNTRIVTVALDPAPEKLQQDVILKFKNLKVDEGEKHCMFWSGLSKSPDGFSGDGCYVDPIKSNSEDTVCKCNHLTHFAVLVDFSGGPELSSKDVTILEIITYVGLCLSIIGILSTITLYFLLTDIRQPLSQIRLSLSVSLGAGQIIFLAGIKATEKTAICVTVAAIMQYFLMAAFCWMLVEGIYLYLFVVKVYNINTKMHMYHVISWGLPVIMVATSLSIAAEKDGIQSYTSDEYCWMSSNDNLIWTFVAFVIIIEVVNQHFDTRSSHKGDGQNAANRRQADSANTGFLIFALHCVRNSQIRERFKRKVSTVFPSATNGNSTKKNSHVNMSDFAM
ncbi:hypothetical protein pdam_00021441, partial [Pocillopora damicornis]